MRGHLGDYENSRHSAFEIALSIAINFIYKQPINEDIAILVSEYK